MIVELGAARLLTPFFGQSLYVWTNVIGVVMGALALGNFLGGRLADRSPKPIALVILLSTAAVLSALAPFMVRPVAGSFMSGDIELEFAFEFLSKGSFLTTVLVFAPPILLLGMILPFLIKFVGWNVGVLGRRAGAVYAASTTGSIVGTFLTSYVLIETLGSRKTFMVAAALIAFAALLSAKPWSRSAAATGALTLIFAATGWFIERAPLDRDAGVLHARDSAYQFIRVREGEPPGTRWLCLNEALDSFHSITIPGQISTGGQYYDYHNLLAAMILPKPSLRVLILGMAAGTNARQLLAYFGDETDVHITGVEIDPAVVEVGREYMELPDDPRLEVLCMDGRAFLHFDCEPFDLVLVDAYAQQTYIPFHMATVEFFEQVKNVLNPGGLVGLNVSAYSRADAVLGAVVNTLAHVFGPTVEAKIPRGRNFLVYASKEGEPPLPSRLEADKLHADLSVLRNELAAPGRLVLRRPDKEGWVLTDDWAPLERLEDHALEGRARRIFTMLEESS